MNIKENISLILAAYLNRRKSFACARRETCFCLFKYTLCNSHSIMCISVCIEHLTVAILLNAVRKVVLIIILILFLIFKKIESFHVKNKHQFRKVKIGRSERMSSASRAEITLKMKEIFYSYVSTLIIRLYFYCFIFF